MKSTLANYNRKNSVNVGVNMNGASLSQERGNISYSVVKQNPMNEYINTKGHRVNKSSMAISFKNIR